MSLFGKKKPALPPLMTEADFDEVANYESALNYLIGLSSDDYTKVTHVAAIHRQANYEAAQVLGTPLEPTTYIHKENDVTDPATAENIADQMLDIEPKTKRKKIAVKQ